MNGREELKFYKYVKLYTYFYDARRCTHLLTDSHLIICETDILSTLISAILMKLNTFKKQKKESV